MAKLFIAEPKQIDPDSPEGLRAERDYCTAELYKGTLDKYTRAALETRLRVAQDRLALLRKADSDKRKAKEESRKKERAENIWRYPGPVAPINMRAKPFGDGTYIHVSDTTETDDTPSQDNYEKVIAWAETFGIDRTVVFAHWGVLGSRYGSELNRENLCRLQMRLSELGKTKAKGAEVMGLFSKTAAKAESGVVQTETGEVIRPKPAIVEALDEDRKRAMCEEVRARLGLRDVIELKDVVAVEKVLRKRHVLLLELSFLMERYEEAKKSLEGDIRDLDAVYYDALKQYRTENPPASGKTIRTNYGELKFMDRSASVALDPERDPGRAKLRAWVSVQTKDLKELFKVEKVETIDFSWDAVKAYMDGLIEKGQTPIVPGTTVTPAEKNKFYIGPSLDTVKDKVREKLKGVKQNAA